MTGSTPGLREKGIATGEKPKVLVIDDEQVILDSARRILTADEFSVLTANDAESALQILETDPQDIAICDLMLPGLSGLEFLDASHEHDPNLVVIITTGYATLDNGIDSLRKGAFDFLPKPFTFEELLSQACRASRFVNLPIGQRVQPSASDFDGRYYLGSQAWARPGVDGTWLLGLTPMLLDTIDPIRSIEFPDAESELQQGGPLARVTTEDGLVHTVWSPLSGEVLRVNDRLEETPDLPHQDPGTHGWLVGVLPVNLEQEIGLLTGTDLHNQY